MEKPNIVIYSTSRCPYCVMLKDWLKANKIEYTDYNVEQDDDKANEMIEKSGQMGVPVSIIEKDKEEQIIIGFDKEAFKKILGIK